MRDSPNLRCSTREDMVTMGMEDEHLNNSYADVDDCVPIDLSKKSSSPRQNDLVQSEERSSPAYAGSDSDKADCGSANWLGSWQRMVASAVSPLLSPFLYLGNGDFADSLKAREDAREKSPVRANGLPIGLTPPYFLGASGGGFENYPVICDQFGVRYALVRTPDGHHVMPVPLAHHLHGAFDVTRSVESMLYQPIARYERDKEEDESESAATKHSKDQCNCGYSRDYRDKSAQLTRYHRHSCPLANGRRSPDESASVTNHRRLQSSSPESYSSLRAILSRKIADVFSTTNGHAKSSDRLENRSLKELLNAAPRLSREFSGAERDDASCSPALCPVKRWHSCSELSALKDDSARTLDRRRSKSDSHIPPSPVWPAKPSPYFAEPGDSLDGLKRKADNESEEEDDNEDQPPDKVGKMQILKCPITRMHNPKCSHTDKRQRQKADRVSASEDDPMDLRASDPNRDDPASNSMNSEQETLLKQLRHVAPPGFPWNVYGYYHHLMQKYQEQEMLKRLSASSTPPCSTPDMSGTKSPSAAAHSYGVHQPAGLTTPVSGGITDNGSEEGDTAAALRKRASRVLTGKHVRHGTGASPTTLMTLRQMIQERQRAKEIALAQGTLNLTGTNGKQSKSHKNSKKAAKVGSSEKKK